jgi:F420H(2)-dependent quinone reductase
VTPEQLQALVDSVVGERTVDIVTTGRRSGRARTTEIWTTVVAGELYVCGTPAAGPDELDRQPRDWLANLLAAPAFTLRLKQSIAIDLPAAATPVTDPAVRAAVLSSPQCAYYREHSRSFEELVTRGPMVHIELLADAAPITEAIRAARLDNPS